MKKRLLFLLLLSQIAFGQINTGTTKSGKYQMNIPDLGVKKDSVVVWDGTSKLLKILPISSISSITNLDYVATATGGTMFSSSGNDAVVPIATTTNSGLLSPTDKMKIDGFQASINLKANNASPQFTGNPYLPTATTGVTQAVGTNTTQLATTAFVTNAMNTALPASGQVSLTIISTINSSSHSLASNGAIYSKVGKIVTCRISLLAFNPTTINTYSELIIGLGTLPNMVNSDSNSTLGSFSFKEFNDNTLYLDGMVEAGPNMSSIRVRIFPKSLGSYRGSITFSYISI